MLCWIPMRSVQISFVWFARLVLRCASTAMGRGGRGRSRVSRHVGERRRMKGSKRGKVGIPPSLSMSLFSPALSRSRRGERKRRGEGHGHAGGGYLTRFVAARSLPVPRAMSRESRRRALSSCSCLEGLKYLRAAEKKMTGTCMKPRRLMNPTEANGPPERVLALFPFAFFSRSTWATRSRSGLARRGSGRLGFPSSGNDLGVTHVHARAPIRRVIDGR